MISFSCRFARSRFLLDAEFSAHAGCVALFGPSGSGKTTIARLIAGLERPDKGRIAIGPHVLVDTQARLEVPVHKRRVGLVFQEGQLLPHLSVRQNLEYGRSFVRERQPAVTLDTVVDLLGIGHLLEARPATLSGGERQRVAIGRALLASPRVLVMDEPLASLDAARKLEILPFIERLRDELHMPIVYVSHAVEEVARLASTVVRVSGGKVTGQGTPAEVFAAANPGPISDGRFDVVSFVSGRVVRELPAYAMTLVAHPAGEIVLPGRFGNASSLRVAIPATGVTIATARPSDISVRTILKGRVSTITNETGPSALVVVELEGGDRISAALTLFAVAELDLAPGRDVYALIKSVSIDEMSVATMGGGDNARDQQ